LKSHDTGREQRFADLDELMAAKSYTHSLAACLVRFFQPAGGFTLETHSESPAGAGISGSSALMIATSAALARFSGREIDIEQLRVIAQNVEAQLIHVPTGCQDYYPAMYGGVSAIHLGVAGVHREEIPVLLDEVDQRFMLFYTGAPRQSGIHNWEVFKHHINGDKKVIRNFAEISRIAQAMHRALASAQWDEVEKLIGEEWKLRRTNAPGISTPLIDKLMEAAMANGGRAAKVCGAGGGGCVIVFIEKGARQRVEDAVRHHGGEPLNFSVAPAGLQFHSAKKEQTARV
jgi:D-glycero-alpha-D-manno-heptose-7-phosphate kinase